MIRMTILLTAILGGVYVVGCGSPSDGHKSSAGSSTGTVSGTGSHTSTAGSTGSNVSSTGSTSGNTSTGTIEGTAGSNGGTTSAGTTGTTVGSNGGTTSTGTTGATGSSTGSSAGSTGTSACLAPTDPCTGDNECCSGYVCGNTSLGQVCCGNAGAACNTPDGTDCCGDLECVNGQCTAPACLAPTQACSGNNECCSGYVCGNTSLGQVCCGNTGAACHTTDGSDCCGALDCINGVCGGSGGSGVIGSCDEASILAATPAAALTFINNALDWVHHSVPYSQVPDPNWGGYRTDCSGLVSMSWGRPPPGETTYAFAGGPWDDGSSFQLGTWDEIQIGDATNYPGDPNVGTGHIRLFAGWLDSGHSQYCSIEEYDYGQVASIRSHYLDTSIYIPIRLTGYSP